MRAENVIFWVGVVAALLVVAVAVAVVVLVSVQSAEKTEAPAPTMDEGTATDPSIREEHFPQEGQQQVDPTISSDPSIRPEHFPEGIPVDEIDLDLNRSAPSHDAGALLAYYDTIRL